MTLTEQAEQAVLGCLVNENRSLYRLGDLQDVDFHDPAHRKLFSLLKDAIQEGSGVDTLTARGFCEDEGDWVYLCELAHAHPSAANVGEYARILKRSRARHRIQFLCEQAAQSAQSAMDDPNTVSSELIVELSRTMLRDRRDLSYTEACELLSAHEARDDDATSTTLPTLDRNLGGGLRPGRLYVLGARPGCYKSALAQQIAMHACANGRVAGIISLEMPPEEIAHRGVKSGYGRSGHLRIDAESYDIDTIAATISEWKHQHGVSLVVVDYLQLIGGKGKNRYETLCEVSRRLKMLAKQFELAILALAQVSREVERENRVPRLNDIRECGNIEQDADCVLFIFREEETDAYSLLIAKQRNGMSRVKPITLNVDGPRFRVREAITQ